MIRLLQCYPLVRDSSWPIKLVLLPARTFVSFVCCNCNAVVQNSNNIFLHCVNCNIHLSLRWIWLVWCVLINRKSIVIAWTCFWCNGLFYHLFCHQIGCFPVCFCTCPTQMFFNLAFCAINLLGRAVSITDRPLLTNFMLLDRFCHKVGTPSHFISGELPNLWMQGTENFAV